MMGNRGGGQARSESAIPARSILKRIPLGVATSLRNRSPRFRGRVATERQAGRAGAAHVAPELVASRPRLAEGNDRLGLILFNVERQSQEFDAAMALLRARDPDVLVLLEIDARWADALESVLARYPHRVVELRADNFGIGLYSKRPLEDARIEHMTALRVPIALATVQLDGGPVRLIAAHPPPPVSAVLSPPHQDRRRARITASTPVPATGRGRSSATRNSQWHGSSAATALSTETCT
jgi:hypothetical protein